jgi:four helix bundle protein
MHIYKQLRVWCDGHALVLEVYKATKAFPKEELYGLSSQIRRSAVSIPSNLAEGASRSSRADFARFVEIAHGSANELEYQLFLSKELGYFDESVHEPIQKRITQLLKGLHQLRLSLMKK